MASSRQAASSPPTPPAQQNTAADRDGDGVNALLEYALGTLDSTPGDPHTRVRAELVEEPNAAGTTRHLTLQFTRNLLAYNTVNLLPEISSDLISWRGSPAVEFVSEENHGDGTSHCHLAQHRPNVRLPAPSDENQSRGSPLSAAGHRGGRTMANIGGDAPACKVPVTSNPYRWYSGSVSSLVASRQARVPVRSNCATA